MGDVLTRAALALGLGTGLALAGGCLRDTVYSCTDDSQCVPEAQGRCERPPGHCSFPDSTCASGMRFGAGGGPYADQCVGELAGTDGGVDGVVADGAIDAAIIPDAVLADAAPCVRLVINEVVIWARRDWDDSTGGNGISFDAVPGTGAFANNTDEWVELYNAGCAVDLTGYSITFEDGTNNTVQLATPGPSQVLRFSAGGSVAQLDAGEYLVIGNPGVNPPSLEVITNVWIHLHAPGGAIVDEVAMGMTTGGDGNDANNAPPGQSSSTLDEAVVRVPNGADTDQDNVDWNRAQATIGAAN